MVINEYTARQFLVLTLLREPSKDVLINIIYFDISNLISMSHRDSLYAILAIFKIYE
jgi:hypothetical protein